MYNINKLFIINIIAIIVLFHHVRSGMTSCHGSSKCLNLRNCKPFMTLIDGLQKPLNPSIVAFLRSQQCGFDRDGYPKVCCRTMPKELRVMNYTTTRIPTENATTTTVIPNYTTTTTTTMSTTTTTKSENLQTTTSINSDLSETTTIISTTTTEENSKNVACKPPRGNTCIEIRSCPYFSELLNKTPIPRPKNVIKFIKEHQCGFHGNVPKVCCSDKYMNLNNMNGNNILLPYKTFKITNHKNFKLLPKDCGKLSDDFRITGGTKASLLEFPWMALIAYDTDEGIDFRCGGTVINNRYVLTAAHCLQNLTFIGVRLGEYNINTEQDCDKLKNYCSQPVQDFYIEDIRIHPYYNASNFNNDIALIKLATPVNLSNPNVQPICLPINDDIDLNGKYGIISGWGVTDDGFKSAILQKTSVNIISGEECKMLYTRYTRITNKQICAGGYFGRDSCAGDSGGPLKYVSTHINGSPSYIQYGIVSYGPRHCGISGQPGVYTKISPYIGWILDNIQSDVD